MVAVYAPRCRTLIGVTPILVELTTPYSIEALTVAACSLRPAASASCESEMSVDKLPRASSSLAEVRELGGSVEAARARTEERVAGARAAKGLGRAPAAALR